MTGTLHEDRSTCIYHAEFPLEHKVRTKVAEKIGTHFYVQ